MILKLSSLFSLISESYAMNNETKCSFNVDYTYKSYIL